MARVRLSNGPLDCWCQKNKNVVNLVFSHPLAYNLCLRGMKIIAQGTRFLLKRIKSTRSAELLPIKSKGFFKSAHTFGKLLRFLHFWNTHMVRFRRINFIFSSQKKKTRSAAVIMCSTVGLVFGRLSDFKELNWVWRCQSPKLLFNMSTATIFGLDHN